LACSYRYCALLRDPPARVYIALSGGIVFLALTAAGLAAEVAVPAVARGVDHQSAVGSEGYFLALAGWLYHYSQIGAAALFVATGYIVWRTGVLPRWSAVLALLALIGVLMLAIPPVVRVESIGV